MTPRPLMQAALKAEEAAHLLTLAQAYAGKPEQEAYIRKAQALLREADELAQQAQEAADEASMADHEKWWAGLQAESSLLNTADFQTQHEERSAA